MKLYLCLGMLIVFGMAGCQKSTPVAEVESPAKAAPVKTVPAPTLPQVDPAKANYRILFFGNSHTMANDIPGLIANMVGSDGSGELAYVKIWPCSFLDEAWQNPASAQMISEGKWTHVVLQAQRYSQSGRFNYSTTEAVEMARHIEKSGAKPVFFPEWRQVGNDDEGRRVHDLHASIVKEAGVGVVSPVGLAWDRALTEKLSVTLHSSDGNHAAIHGGFLTAAVLYGTITGRDPKGIHKSVMPEFDTADREKLLNAAHETIDAQEQGKAGEGGGNPGE